jgi:hypothetical protein
MTGFLPKDANPSDLLIGLIISVTGWAWGARVLRVRRCRSGTGTSSSRRASIGERGWRIVSFEILPVLVPIIASSVPVHRHLRRRHLYGAGVSRPDQRNALELGHGPVLGAEPDGRPERVLVVVGAARPSR